jgi:hypothetical protein
MAKADALILSFSTLDLKPWQEAKRALREG